MLTIATSFIYITLIIVNYKSKNNTTIDLSCLLAAMLGDIILLAIVKC